MTDTAKLLQDAQDFVTHQNTEYPVDLVAGLLAALTSERSQREAAEREALLQTRVNECLGRQYLDRTNEVYALRAERDTLTAALAEAMATSDGRLRTLLLRTRRLVSRLPPMRTDR